MKKTLLLLVIAALGCSLHAQNLKSKALYAGYWGKKTQLEFSTDDQTQKVQMMALGKRIKGTYKRVKPIKINGTTYRIIRTEGVVHIQNEAEETVLMTSNRQMKVTTPQGELYLKDKHNRKRFVYVDQAGSPIIEARLRNNIFNHTIEITMHKDEPLMLALCLEMLTKRAREEVITSL